MGLTTRLPTSRKIPEMYINLRNDANTFNVNQDPPENFRLPGVKVWKDSDSVIKDAKSFVPKAITVAEGSGGVVQTPTTAEGPTPSSVPSHQPAPLGGTGSCGDEHVSSLLAPRLIVQLTEGNSVLSHQTKCIAAAMGYPDKQKACDVAVCVF